MVACFTIPLHLRIHSGRTTLPVSHHWSLWLLLLATVQSARLIQQSFCPKKDKLVKAISAIPSQPMPMFRARLLIDLDQIWIRHGYISTSKGKPICYSHYGCCCFGSPDKSVFMALIMSLLTDLGVHWSVVSYHQPSLLVIRWQVC